MQGKYVSQYSVPAEAREDEPSQGGRGGAPTGDTSNAPPSSCAITCLAVSAMKAVTSDAHYCMITIGGDDGSIAAWAVREAAGGGHAATPAASPVESSTRHVKLHSLLHDHQGRVNHLAFRPSDRHQHAASALPNPAGVCSFWFASASSDASIRIWSCNVGTGSEGTDSECIYRLDEFREVMWCNLEHTGTGDLAIYSSGRGFIHQWSLKRQEASSEEGGGGGGGGRVGAAGDGGKASSAEGAQALEAERAIFASGELVCKTIPGGAHAATTHQSNPNMGEKSMKKLLAAIEGGRQRVGMATVSETDQRNVNNRKCCLLKTRAAESDVHDKEEPVLLAFSDVTLLCWDIEATEAEHVLLPGTVDCAFSQDKTSAVSISADGYMRVWTCGARASSKRANNVQEASGAEAAVQSKFKRNWQQKITEARQAFLVQHGGDPVSPSSGMVRRKPGLLKGKFSHQGPVTGVSISCDGKTIVSVGGGEAMFFSTEAPDEFGPRARIGHLAATGQPGSDEKKISSGASYYFSSERGSVKNATFVTGLGERHSMQKMQQDLVVVVGCGVR